MKKRLLEIMLVAAPKMAGGVLVVLLNVVLLHFLDPVEFGLFSLCSTSILLIDAIVGTAIDMAVLRQAPLQRQISRENCWAVEAGGLFLKVGMISLLSLLLALSGPLISQGLLQGRHGNVLIALTALAAFATLLLRSSLLHAQISHDFWLYGKLEWAQNVVKYGAIGTMLAIGGVRVELLLLALVAGPLSAFMFSLRGIGRAWLSVRKQIKQHLPELIQYIKWFFPTIVVGTIVTKMDIYMLSSVSGLASLGVFSAAVAIAMIPELFGTYIGIVLYPRIMPALKDKRFHPFFKRVQKVLVLASLAGMALAWMFLQPLLETYFPARYSEAAPLALILLLGAFGGMCAYPVLVPYLMFEKPRFMLTLDGVLFIPLALAYYSAISMHGVWGAAWVTAGSRIFRTLIAHFCVRHWSRAT